MDERKSEAAATTGRGDANKRRQVSKILEAIKNVSRNLQSNSDTVDCDLSVRTLSELESKSDGIFSGDPLLSSVPQHLSELNDLLQELRRSKPGRGIRSFVTRRLRSHEISRVSGMIESELQAWNDRETVLDLTRTLYEETHNREASIPSSPEEEAILPQKMDDFREILSRGFDINLQDLLLKSRIFSNLESVLCNPNFPKTVQEKAAMATKELVLYNKDVFVGLVLGGHGQTVKSLVSMGSLCSLQVLCSLIKAIRSPLVDEMESCGGISKIVSLLESEDLGIRLMAFNCVLEIGYFGRKEAIQSMLDEGLIKKLVKLQRSETKSTKDNLFAGCVAKFTIQLEVGEGLRQREKRSFKLEILEKLKEVCVSEAEAATISAEVLWGASP